MNVNPEILVLAASLAAAFLTFFLWKRAFSNENDKERDYLAEAMAAMSGEAEDILPEDGKKKLSDRLRVAAARVGSRIPLSEETATKARMQLARAGVDMPVPTFYGAMLMICVFGAAAALVAASLLQAAPAMRIAAFAAVLSCALFAPWVYLKSARRKRVEELDRVLPDDIDLLVVTARAGRSLTTGLQSVAKHCDDAFSRELRTAVKEIAAGVTRADALRGVRDRCDTEACDAFLSALIQAEQRGGETADFLARQAELCRERLRLAVETKVNKVGVKITLVLCLVIFPTMLIITLAPTALTLFEAFSSVGLAV